MKKSDLRTGMLVQTREGYFALVMLNTETEDCLVSDGGSNDRAWCMLDTYNEDLERFGIPSSDIVAVYSSKRSNQHRGSFSTLHRDRLWKRETVSVKLNSEYTAKVDQSKKTVQVGCQTFEFEKIEELYKAIKNEQNKD
jgi:anti-sigma28 factor (negative regulator of flagellin synthesis)